MATQSYALFTPVIAIGSGVATLTLTDTNDGTFEVPDINPGGQSALINGSPVVINSVEAAIGPQIIIANVGGLVVELSITPVRIVVEDGLFDDVYIVYPGLPPGAEVISVSVPLIFPNPVGLPVCLTVDTRVKTSKGWVKAGDLQLGDLVVTRGAGLQPVRWIGKQQLRFVDSPLLEKFRPIHFDAGSLGDGVPRWPLTVSPQHAILLRDRFASLLFGESEVLVAAKHFVNGTTVRVDAECDEITYCHILLDLHAIILAEGAEVESLYLGEQTLASIGSEARAEVLAIFPELANRSDTRMERARMLLREFEARVLIDRMFGWKKPATDQTEAPRQQLRLASGKG
ncbi:Hint domain-containing protein [Rhodobacter sp. SY28-1]|uniref:Hint domain-containing protein n=1 Tax=Rhodobacter sp. SY28-1 TaxID=2562317 RepID=UPI0010C00441|nr:Hint domain-containing protein [Rhodobacter sp. SY28-1]